ncbi:carboxymethylenebutenolidase [Phyllobacterium brassicacearum]|uniref:Carboxymethylenebutenolidase n=1 Tax=Phyllobacterium brassicacearum TaxID=314235 RepID=A0A2P7BU11_9HYPH|nr:dienelactone hydrolase family protein [Phyllobacterium brassicacearum]PSH69911.1 carboxymethylenebutenolidase [Phyllobacterium brassicacearum]TDQ35084.1 carboxymethylenebutenolidase [Phyllobacterium brassicacearum]
MNEPTKTPRISQAMVEAYDEYTHLTLDRRSFMDKLTKLAGSGAAAAIIAPMLAANSARAAIVAADDSRLRTKDIVFPGPSGDIKGYRVNPADASGKLPAVIVIHENRGLNDHIRDVGRRLALEGFIALAPDLLSSAGGTPSDEEKAREMIGALDSKTAIAEGVATIEYLKKDKSTNGKVGAVGFCWGGGMVNDLAVNAPDLGAGVAYYGRQAKPEDVAKIKAPLLLQYAGLDTRINAGIDAYKKALEENDKTFEIFVYEGANHAFNNDTSEARYDKNAADLAWGRTVEFFKKNLS